MSENNKICPVCGKETYKVFEVFGKVQELPVLCDCAVEERNKIEEEYRKKETEIKIQRLKDEGLTDAAYRLWTFEKDDKSYPHVSEICQLYVNDFRHMQQKNHGIIFYGPVGTGKSFMACCIANRLMDNGTSVLVTSFPQILSKSFEDISVIINKINRFELLVIDDFGTERNSDYTIEIIFNVIDARYRSGKPLIITTNLSAEQLKNPSSTAHKRIYDRILEMCCIPIKMIGESKRIAITQEKRGGIT